MSQHNYFTPLRVGVFGVALAIGIVLALTPFRPTEQFPVLGTVADRDIVASHEAMFISASLTAEAQEVARSEVAEQFEFNPDIRPAQLEVLRLYLDAVTLERSARRTPLVAGDATESSSDEETDDSAQTAAPSPIPGSKLAERDETFLIAVSDPLFGSIRRESQVVLETLLQERLYEERLDSVRLTLHDRVAPALSLTETALVSSLVAAYLRPTMIESPALTQTGPGSGGEIGGRRPAYGRSGRPGGRSRCARE